jgi:uncharacterized protein YvpB
MSFSSRFFVKILIFSIICLLLSFLVAGADAAFGIIFPPKIINSSPENAAQNVSTNYKIIINFNKPINGPALEYSISPQVSGNWKFENPFIDGRFFKTLVFEPAADFSGGTNYKVEIRGIKGFLGIKNNSFSLDFKTIENPNPAQFLVIKNYATSTQATTTLIKTFFEWQKYNLSCEAASLKMALSAKGITVSEDEIMDKIGFDPTPHENGVWGDPNIAFVGDINGRMCDTGYGVHWEPVAKAANNWREAEAFSGWNLKKLIDEIQRQNPVIFWGIVPVNNVEYCSWQTPQGKHIKIYKETHVRLVVGFVGDPENPEKIIIEDPLYGKIYWKTDYFLKNWGSFNFSGVVVR